MDISLKTIWNGITSKKEKPQPKADFTGTGTATYTNLFTWSFNGEKNLGEIGPAKNYVLDYELLRIRSWQSLLESEITQTVINRYATWVVGKGQKLQSEPNYSLLKYEGIDLDRQKFANSVEARFNTWKKSSYSDYSRMANLDIQANTAFINSMVGGDVLAILRFDEKLKTPTVQLIDGAHIQSPLYGTETFPQDLPDGHKIIYGVEVDEKKTHIAYWVKTSLFTNPKRIPAFDSTGKIQMAFLVIGKKYRIDNVRGIPLISVIMETLAKLSRYKEATVGSAEEVAKVAYQINHENFSTGENPLAKNLAKAFDADSTSDRLPIDAAGNQIANNIAVTTNKLAFNMPLGAKIQPLNQPNGQINYKDFYNTNIDSICASIGIPPNVAMSKYDSNFSASRAALKDWENTLQVERERFAFQFYQKVYIFFLHMEILMNNISATGYLKAYRENNFMVLEAFRSARFVGAIVPHIDPLKEVNAEREKLGDQAKGIPLTTVEAATESLNGGDATSNMEQFSLELNDARTKKIIPETGTAN